MFKEGTQAVILAGGFGSRLSELTHSVPKPMVEVGGQPILMRIMSSYAQYGIRDFVILTGYKSEIIKQFFLMYKFQNSDFEIDFANDLETLINSEKQKIDWKIKILDTGLNTMTGGRLARAREHIQGRFFLTYGDGLSDINLIQLMQHHELKKKIATVTAVRPRARFGRLEIQDGVVNKFEEKPETEFGFINGGYFVFEPNIFDYLTGDDCILEQEPLTQLSQDGMLAAYEHTGFWQCVDTLRDKQMLDKYYANATQN